MAQILKLLGLFISLAAATCSPRDYESLVGGYPSAHETQSMTFDVNPVNSDLLVAGKMLHWETNYGFIYHISEDWCRIRWAFYTDSFSLGVRKIAFNPSDPRLIYGVGVGYRGSLKITRMFYIDNSDPSKTNFMTVFGIEPTTTDSIFVYSLNVIH